GSAGASPSHVIAGVLLCVSVALAAPATTQSLGDAPAPTRVTLHFDGTPAKDALEQLLKQAGLSTATASESVMKSLGDLKITADFTDQPFMLALKELCRQAYLEPLYNADAFERVRFTSRL